MELTRREAIAAGVGVLASGVLPGCASLKSGGRTPAGDIDAHSHIWSDDLEHYPLGPWATPADMQPPTFTAEQLLALMKANGVGRAVIIQHAPLHGYDNRYVIDTAHRYPGVFSVVGMINERTPHLRERLRDLRDQGVRGIRIGPTNNADRTLRYDPPNWLKEPGMQALWKHAAELGVALCPLLDGSFLPGLCLMCAQHRDTVCVVDHFGRIDFDDPAQVRSLTRLAMNPNVYIKASAFRNLGDKRAPYDDVAPMVRVVVDAFGADRVMWGSDCPYQLNNGNNYADALALIREGMSDLSQDERNAILHGTAAKVFF